MARSRPPLHLALGFGHLALGVVALTSLACRTPSSKIPLEKLDADTSEPGTGEAREVVEPLPVERPADLLPAEVPLLAEALDPASVLALISSLDKYPEFAGVRSELRSGLGGDPLDPQGWAALGFDVHGPAGMGLIDVEAEAFFVYLSLVDEGKFEQTLDRFATMIGVGDEYSSMDVGGVRVHRLDRKASVVVRERIAMLIVVDDPEQAPRDYVVTAATIDPRESLGRSERYAWAREQIAAGDDGYLFFNPVELLAQIDREQQANRSYGLRYAEEELARARSLGEPQEVIREYERRVEEERNWQREREARDAAERQLRDDLLGGLQAFVAAADLRVDGIFAHGRALMPGPSLLRRLFVAPERESPLLAALAEAPLFTLDGRVDLQVMLELVEQIAKADGESLAQVNDMVRIETGVDLINGVIPALTGAGGFALTQDKKPDPKRLGEIPKTLGVAAYAQLRDPEPIRKALDQVARDKRMGGALTKARRGDGWVLSVPEWRDVELTIVGDRLVAATDGKLAARIRDAEPGGLAASLTAEHPLRGSIVSPALRVYGRFVGVVLVEADEPWKQDAETLLYDYNSHATLSPDEAAKVPRSKEFKRKFAELEQVVAELNRVNLQREQKQFEEALRFTEQIGDVGWQLEPATDGLALAAQWRFAPGMTPIEIGYQVFTMRSDSDWVEYDRLNSQMFAILDELRTIRQADLDAAAAKKK